MTKGTAPQGAAARIRDVIVVGGGVAGLTTAYGLARAGRDVLLLEARARLGGNLITEREDGFVFDGGPDSWLATKPHATALARELGLGEELVPTAETARKVYVAWEGELHEMPEGLVLGIPTRVMPIAKSRLFTWDAKLRMALEPVLVPRRYVGDEDESVAEFVTRRLGDQVLERLAGPLLGGIFAGDPAAISVRAAFPQLVEAERGHGSLVRAMRANRRRAAEVSAAAAAAADENTPKDRLAGSTFVSLRGGVGTLIEGLARALGPRARTQAAVGRVSPIEPGRPGIRDHWDRWSVELAGGETYRTRSLVLAIPAWVASGVVRGFDAAMADALGAVEYVSTATVFLAFAASDIHRPLDGVGFVVPHAMRRSILAGTWVSSKWDERAPADAVLMRVFFGGAFHQDDLARDDEGLIALAREELRALVGVDAAPTRAKVFRFDRASPQPTVGHLARMRALRAQVARWAGLHLAGTWLEGTGIPDAVRQGRALADRLAAGDEGAGGMARGDRSEGRIRSRGR